MLRISTRSVFTALLLILATTSKSDYWEPVTNFAEPKATGISHAGDWFFLHDSDASGLRVSRDGNNWERARIINNPHLQITESIVYHNGVYLAATSGYESVLARSTDGKNWTTMKINDGAHINNIVIEENRFSAYDRDGKNFVSFDGKNWEMQSKAPFAGSIIRIVAPGDNTLLAAVTDNHSLSLSIWKKHKGTWTLQDEFELLNPILSGGSFRTRIDSIALELVGRIYRDNFPVTKYAHSIYIDSKEWSPLSLYSVVPLQPEILFSRVEIRSDGQRIISKRNNIEVDTQISSVIGFAKSANRVLAASSNGGIYSSANGTDWLELYMPSTPVKGAVTSPDSLVIYGGSKIITTSDGLLWNLIENEHNAEISNLQYAENRFFGFARRLPTDEAPAQNFFVSKTEDTDWTFKETDVSASSIVFFNDAYYASGGYTVLQSTDGVDWQVLITDTPDNSIKVFAVGNTLCAITTNSWYIQINSNVYITKDGIHWEKRELPFRLTNINLNGEFRAKTSNGVAQSTDGIEWIETPRPTDSAWIYIADSIALAIEGSRNQEGLTDYTVYHFNSASKEWIPYSFENRTDTSEYTYNARGDIVFYSIGSNTVDYLTVAGDFGSLEMPNTVSGIGATGNTFYYLASGITDYYSENAIDWLPYDDRYYGAFLNRIEFKGEIYTYDVDGTNDIFLLAAGFPKPGRFVNVSNRSIAKPGGEEAIHNGFVIQGSGPFPALLRSVGPSLANHGISSFAPNPKLSLFKSRVELMQNNDWSDFEDREALTNASTNSGAFPLNEPPLDSSRRDAALVANLQEGIYTAVSSSDTSGIVLSELYAIGAPTGTNLVNVSTRSRVSSGEGVAILGFVIDGDERATLLIRAVGPTLTQLDVQNPVSDPTLSLYNNRNELHQNDNWSDAWEADRISSAGASTGAFAIPEGSKDSAMLVTLEPGIYTAIARSNDENEGIVLLEAYLVDPNTLN